MYVFPQISAVVGESAHKVLPTHLGVGYRDPFNFIIQQALGRTIMKTGLRTM